MHLEPTWERMVRRASVLICAAFFLACDSEVGDDPIPIASFPDITLDLNFPENAALRNTGGSRAINGGVRGIILHRLNASTIQAFERNCSFQPLDACATVDVHSSGLFMIDSCCESSFSFNDGNPTGGPASRPLREYQTQFNGNTLIITDTFVN